jgi:hypothetical protein
VALWRETGVCGLNALPLDADDVGGSRSLRR